MVIYNVNSSGVTIFIDLTYHEQMAIFDSILSRYLHGIGFQMRKKTIPNHLKSILIQDSP